MKHVFITIVLVGGVLALAACSKQQPTQQRNMTPAQISAIQAASAAKAAKMASASTPAMSTHPGTVGAAMPSTQPGASGTTPMANVAYVAHLQPLNGSVTGTKASGEARFAIDGDQLTIRINAQGLAPSMMHMQHFHGFKNGDTANCATQAADVNGDGIVDIVETEAVSGITMVPFDGDPIGMDIAAQTYPNASGDGTYWYQKTVSLQGLQSAFAKAYDGQKLDLTQRVVYIHGVPADTTLPESVASLGDFPAQATLPVACGVIEPASP